MIQGIYFNGNVKPVRKNNTSVKKDCSILQNYKNYKYSGENSLANINRAKINFTGIQKIDDNFPKHNFDSYAGCLIGGAIGDALGAPVEFMTLDEIKYKYGKEGIQDLELNEYGEAEFTDDTQMTMFTADGLIKALISNPDYSKLPDFNQVYSSYQDWLATQFAYSAIKDKGWISKIDKLYANMSPGNTCIGSLMSCKKGSIEKPINSSKGCGGVMRTAPAGLIYYKNPKLAFEVGARCAALTHGNPNAYLPAGVHSCIIANIIQGKSLEEAIDEAVKVLKTYNGCEDTLELIEDARTFAKTNLSPHEAIKELGQGWTGEEAIAIAIYSILKSPDNFEEAVKIAINHNGDSDSTGAIAGNILGAYLGAEKLPDKWKKSILLSNELNILSKDLLKKPNEIEDKENRYFI